MILGHVAYIIITHNCIQLLGYMLNNQYLHWPQKPSHLSSH